MAAFRIVVVYAMIAALWLLGSGSVLGWIFHDSEQVTRIGLYKGLCFVLATATLLYLLMARYLGSLAEARRKLVAHEARLRTIYDSMGESVLVMNPDTGRVVDVNHTVSDMYGYSREEALTLDVGDLSCGEAPFSRKEALAYLRAAAEGVPLLFEWLAKKKDGSIFWVEVSMRNAPLVDGDQLVVLVRDISERKLLEKRLRITEFSVENMLDSVYWSTIDGRFISVNGAACAMLGYSREELLQLSIPDIDPGYDRQKLLAHRQEIFTKGNRRFETVHRTRDGRCIAVEIASSHIRYDGQDYFCSIVRDITERLRAEEEVSFFRNLVEYTRDPIYVLNQGGRVVYANQAACSHFGMAIEELRNKSIPDWDPDFDMVTLEHVFRELKQGKSLRFETRHRVASGALVPVEVSANLLVHAGQDLSVGSFFDISERKQAEEELRASEARYRGLIELFPEAIYIHTGGKLVFANSQGARLVGAKRPEDLYGREALDFVHPDYRDFVANRIGKAYREGTSNPAAEEVFLRLDGSSVLVEVASNAFIYHGEKALQIVARDISERKKRQEELLKAQKLESLGVLAGGIAHDFNNLLTGILGNLSMMRAGLAADHPLQTRLESCEKAINQATGLTCQLLTFSRGGEPVKKLFDLRPVIRDTVVFALRGSNVAHELLIDDGLWPLEADLGQVCQVLNNLIINADQSMPCGGVVQVEARNCSLAPAEVPPLDPGNYVQISVSDQGTGISPENLDKIFDPYFTTKESGSGLGLTSLYSIVKKHHGQVLASSRLGIGTVFRVYLPASPEKKGLIHAAEGAPDPVFCAEGAFVLVMDDELSIRDLTAEMLRLLGCRVETCSSGEELITLYQREVSQGGKTDAVIMDLTIPGKMGGVEAAQRILEIDREARLIVSSGYSNDPVMANYRAYGFVDFLVKPYRIEDLSAALSRIQ
jgi:PAS domain S-box-containing protein